MHHIASITVLASIFALAPAHLFIASPPPLFIGDRSDRKSPLDATGRDFPCKMKDGDQLPTSGGTPMQVGTSELLMFDTSVTATHGGGSCQVSITYETERAKIRDPRNWYVILSIEGGCPSNAAGNIEASTSAGITQCDDPRTDGINCLNKFNFTLPDGLKSGHATLAWTWFNRVGNREMYMNCASVQIQGGTGTGLNQLPAMFVANIQGSDLPSTCGTVEGGNLKFPNPGAALTVHEPAPKPGFQGQAQTYPLAAPTGTCPDDSRGASDATVPTQQKGGSGPGAGGGSGQQGFGAQSVDPQLVSEPAGYSSPVLQNPPSYSSPVIQNPPSYPSQFPDASKDQIASDSLPQTSPLPVQPSSGVYDGGRAKRVKYVTITRTVPGSRSGSTYGKEEANGQYLSQPVASTSTSAPISQSVSPGLSSSRSSAGSGAGVAYASASASESAAGSAAGSGSGSATACADAVSCSTPGQLVCIDATHFGLCDLNHCAIPRSVAAGTQCANGAIGFADAGAGGGGARRKLKRGGGLDRTREGSGRWAWNRHRN